MAWSKQQIIKNPVNYYIETYYIDPWDKPLSTPQARVCWIDFYKLCDTSVHSKFQQNYENISEGVSISYEKYNLVKWYFFIFISY